MVLQNITATAPGQVFEFGYDVPLRGLTAMTTVIDFETGVTGTRFWSKKFCYTLDGLNYTDWEDLTDPNLAAVSIPIKNDFMIRFRYERDGVETSGNLSLTEIIVNGTYSLSYLQILNFNNTFLSGVSFTDRYFNILWQNLLEKLFEPGIIPRHIERGDDTKFDDEHYIVYWKIMSYMFAALGSLRKIEVDDFFEYTENIVEFLKQRTFYVCGTESLTLMKSLLSSLFAQFAARGTEVPFLEDSDWLTPASDPEHGEVRRMFCYTYEDEFLYNLSKGDNVGWFINRVGPNYNGPGYQRMLNKIPGYGLGPDFPDSVPANWTSNIVSILTDSSFSNKQVLSISQGGSIVTPKIKIDHTIGYVISFRVRKTDANTADIQPTIVGYDIDDNTEDLFTHEPPHSQANLLVFFQILNSDLYYEVRGYIYPSDDFATGSSSAYDTDSTGKNLKFSDQVHSITINLSNVVVGAGDLYIWDFRMIPMVFPNTNYINAHAITTVWARNRNNNVETEKLLWDMRRYIVPYNSLVRLVSLDRDPVPSSNEFFVWYNREFEIWLTADEFYWSLAST